MCAYWQLQQAPGLAHRGTRTGNVMSTADRRRDGVRATDFVDMRTRLLPRQYGRSLHASRTFEARHRARTHPGTV